ncbi:nitroreductase family protein [Gordonia sp. N1V]|uniref:nitroreductase family protein n=1 Tax=Gordonia sp. N1V TaxID=3034163 RepID=UPI0023E347EC|nr:nitroreductase family protein [Gordonia sp. N1V]MDF3281683.1 nitroreductase family protein [Gordonia sp. N1V]
MCKVPARPEVHPALATRFSPVAFDPDTTVSTGQVDTLLDAARRAPSAGNSQPWMFIVAHRGDGVHRRIVPHLARSSTAWVPDASLLVVNLAQVYVEGTTDWEYSEFSRYDLGQAVAHMIIQGLSVGLDAHQFRAFDRDAIAAEFEVQPHFEVTSMTAFGLAAHAAGELSAPGTSRERASIDEITWARE